MPDAQLDRSRVATSWRTICRGEGRLGFGVSNAEHLHQLVAVL